MNLYLVRHGESLGNKEGRHQTPAEPLSRKGISQAKAVARRLKKIPIDIVYTSTMVRAVQTAEIIAKSIDKKIELWEPLHEMKRPSIIQGVSSRDPLSLKVTGLIYEKFTDTSYKYADEENFVDLNARAEAVLAHLYKYHKTQNVLCVSHGTFTKALVGKVIFGDKLTPEMFLQIRHHTWKENTGITHCEYSDKHGWSLLTWNDVTHL